MHRYEELEKIYYKKKFLKFISIFFVLVISIGIFFIFPSLNKENEKNITKNIIKEKTININQKKEINTTKLNKKIEKVSKNTQKEKNVSIVKNENQKLTFILPKITEKQKNIIKENKPVKKDIKKRKEIKEIKKTKTTTSKKIPPSIKIEEKKISVNELIRKFNTNPNYDIAMIIAKEYFKIGDLNNARIWVIKANNLKPEDVDSWLLFADILLKNNEKEKALKILNVYIDTYGDNPLIEAKIRSINE